MKVSKGCIYGMWAALYLALQPGNGYISIHEISHALDIPFHFLAKILHIMARKELLLTVRGANGGVKLGRSAEEIKLKDIIEAIDGPQVFSDCLWKLPVDRHNSPCLMHDQWAIINKQIIELTENTSLSMLANESEIREFFEGLIEQPALAMPMPVTQ